MTETLSTGVCEPCRKGAPPVTAEEIEELRPQIPDWELQDVDGVPRLVREFTFENFARALEFTNRVGAIAEAQGHHPVIVLDWGRVTVSWWTHKIRNLHRNDFIMAAQTDDVYMGRR